jgi:hypothetical protein
MTQAFLMVNNKRFRLYEWQILASDGKPEKVYNVSFSKDRISDKWFWTVAGSKFPTQLHEWADDLVKVLNK